MFELADFLVGIYKTNDCTHSLTIKNADKATLIPAKKARLQPEPMDTSDANDAFDQVRQSETVDEERNEDDKEN